MKLIIDGYLNISVSLTDSNCVGKNRFGIMKLLLLPALMAFFAVAQVFCEENDPKEEADYWASSNQIQVVYSRGLFIFSI